MKTEAPAPFGEAAEIFCVGATFRVVLDHSRRPLTKMYTAFAAEKLTAGGEK